MSRWSAAAALAAAHADGAVAYDEIGSRLRAQAPQTGPVPLQTLPDVRRERDARERVRLPDDIQDLVDVAEKLGHRSIALSRPTKGYDYEVRGNVIDIIARDAVWTFPLTAPPRFLLDEAVDDDVPAGQGSPPGAYWLPLSTLIAHGRVERMQGWRDVLVTEVQPGRLCLFISHRWLTPEHPDPAGEQVAMTAWQVFAAVCDAARVAHQRGLHRPRQRNAVIRSVVGVSGAELAEAVIVNVLRPMFQGDDVAGLNTEATSVQALIADRGAGQGLIDIGLANLREVTAGLPLIRSVLDRILLWYDYASMPQRPFADAAEQRAFEVALNQLASYQDAGRTVILLDDADTHLTRAWCTLEALNADGLPNTMDVLPGTRHAADRFGDAQRTLLTALLDRPHLVRRAIVDTAMFGLQTPVECMARLQLTATNAADLPLIYSKLLSLHTPARPHMDDMEVVSGTFPLPSVDNGQTLVVPTTPSPPYDMRLVVTGSLDASDATQPGLEPPGEPQRSWQRFADRGAHVAIVASFEGEAMLAAGWVYRNRSDLAEAVGEPIATMTWIASDIAPVGHRPEAALRTIAVQAAHWVLLTHSARLGQCATTATIIDAARAATRRVTTICWDILERNVARLGPTAAQVEDDRARTELRERILSGIGRIRIDELTRPRRSGSPAYRIPMTDARQLDVAGGVFRAGLAATLASIDTRIPPMDVIRSQLGSIRPVKVTFQSMDNPWPTVVPEEPFEGPRGYREAERLAAAGDYEASKVLLRRVLSQWSGTDPRELQSDAYALLGRIALHQREYAAAMANAQEAIRRTGRTAGAAVVARQRRDLDVARLAYNAARGDPSTLRLIAVRRHIAAAQDLSDELRDESSADVLRELLANPTPETHACAAKIHGLLGLSLHRLGDVEGARQHTERALAEATRADDHDGVRVYRANLETMREKIES